MTVSSSTFKVTYNANGSATVWSIPFAFPDAASILVYVKDALGGITQIPATQYQVSLNPLVGANPTPTGGSVTFPLAGPPLAIGSQISIVRSLSFTQQVSLGNQSIIYPAVVEKEFDYLTMLLQQGVPILSINPFEE